MRLFIALAAATALAALTAPAAAQTRECKAFRSGPGWAVKYVAYTRADGRVFDTVATYTYQVTFPEKKPTDVYEVNADTGRLGKLAKGVLLLEYGKRPDGEALGKVLIAAPAFSNMSAVIKAGLMGEETPAFEHRLVLKAGPSRARVWTIDAMKVRAPPVMDALQYENATAALGSSDIEMLGAGGLADARKGAAIVTQLGKGGRVDILMKDYGQYVSVGGFDITPAVARAATDAAAQAKAEADARAAKGQCVPG